MVAWSKGDVTQQFVTQHCWHKKWTRVTWRLLTILTQHRCGNVLHYFEQTLNSYNIVQQIDCHDIYRFFAQQIMLH